MSRHPTRSAGALLRCVALSCGLGPLTAQTVAELAAELAHAERYEDEVVGFGQSEVYGRYALLAARASVDELVALAAHDAPVVRCYAVRALVEGGHTQQLGAVVRAHLHDTEPLQVATGCLRYEQRAGDLIFALARPQLPAEDLLDVGEQLVARDSPLFAREWALRNLRFRDGMLHALRALAADGDRPALIALARFRLRTDLPLLIEQLHRAAPFDDNCAFLAAETHPHPDLMDALVALDGAARRRLQRDNPLRLRFWLRAITAQQSPAAARFLARFLASDPVQGEFAQRELRRALRRAIAAHPAAVFTPLQQRLGPGAGR